VEANRDVECNSALTTNSVEGWNCQLNSITGEQLHNILRLVQKLKEAELVS
jgi:hypothetical protein